MEIMLLSNFYGANRGDANCPVGQQQWHIIPAAFSRHKSAFL